MFLLPKLFTPETLAYLDAPTDDGSELFGATSFNDADFSQSNDGNSNNDGNNNESNNGDSQIRKRRNGDETQPLLGGYNLNANQNVN